MAKGDKKKAHPMDRHTHRRILEFINAARGPQDLMVIPPQAVKVDEPRGFRGPDPHDLLQMRHGTKKERPLLERKVAEQLFHARDEASPLYGFRHLREVAEILDRRTFRLFTGLLSTHFGPATRGAWRDGDRVVNGTERVNVAHAGMLCSGKVLFIEAACSDIVHKSETPLYDPDSGALSFPAPPQVGTEYENLYCAGHSFLSDGKLLAVGGGGENGETPVPDLAWIFDPDSESWDFARDKGNPDPATNRERMKKGRWYPTVVTLGDRRVFIASGWPSLTDSKMEIYSEATGRFTLVTTQDPPGDKDFGQLYPGLHHIPDGRVFYAPTGWGGGTIEPSASIDLFTGATPAWTDHGSTDRGKGMSVQILSRDYPYVRVMVVGGDTTGKNTSYQVIDLSVGTPSWPSDASLPLAFAETTITPRTNVNLVLLPNNTVFMCGGTSANQPCWLYDPDAAAGSEWTQMAALNTIRAYHSFALLIPSGEVLVSGSNGANDERNLIQIFSPPYLFLPDGTRIPDSDRPQITSVTEYPNVIHHGQTFEISTPDPSAVDRVVFVRPMAVTHQTDSEQRVIELEPPTVVNGNTISVVAPNGWHPHAKAPAGCYMLFIISAGVPSHAKFILLH